MAQTLLTVFSFTFIYEVRYALPHKGLLKLQAASSCKW